MKLAVVTPEGRLDLDVEVERGTLRHLLMDIDPDGDHWRSEVVVDGYRWPVDTALSELPIADGSLIDVAGELPQSTDRDRTVAVIEMASGPGTGIAVPVAEGRYRVGSGPTDHLVVRAPGVAAHHADLVVADSGDLQIDGHSWPVDASVRLGDCILVHRTPAALPGGGNRHRSGHGRIAFNRPPGRHPEGVRPPPIPIPAVHRSPHPRQRMGIAALVVPLIFGGVLAVLIHPRMALFALLGPVMMGAGWLDDRRVQRRHRHTVSREVADQIAQIDDLAARHAVAERHHRIRHHPTTAQLVEHAYGSTMMWERRPGHPEFLRLSLGIGVVGWTPPTEGDLGGAAPPIREAVTNHRTITGPAVVDLTALGTLGLAGERTAAADLARGLILEAATLHGPADLRIAIVTDSPDQWDWAKWLPHTVADDTGRRFLGSAIDEIDLVATMIQADTSAQFRPATLLVVDGVDLSSPVATPLRHALACESVVALVLADHVHTLPASCSTVVHIDRPGIARVEDADGLNTVISATGAHIDIAERASRLLARFSDPYSPLGGTTLPKSVSLADLVDDLTSPDALAGRWQQGTVGPVPIGIGDTGLVTVDLVTDGPHALVAGTTGSGKSEFLRTLVASMAAHAGPDQVTFVLIDYKGGSAFDACADLPHTVGVVTDLDDHLAARALVCLEAELRRREHLLRAAGVDDIRRYSDPDAPLPRMVVVIDEFAALAAELPHFLDALVDIGARGRSLGLHLIVATQRPAGVVRDQLRANTNLRIGLRVQDRHDAVDVIGDSCAADIGRHQAGRGWIRFGPGDLVRVQAAQVTVGSHDSGAVTARPFRFAAEPDVPLSPIVADDDGGDLRRLVVASRIAFERSSLPAPYRPWPDPLPDEVDAAALDTPDGTAIAVGLVDEPDLQRTATFTWSPASGSTVLYGAGTSGPRRFLERLATALIDRVDPAALHLYVLDQTGTGFDSLERFPQVGGVVGPDEGERRIRLLRMLDAEVERRRSARQLDLPTVVVLIDDIGILLDVLDEPGERWKDMVVRLVAEGPRVGIVTVFTATRTASVPSSIAATLATKLIFRIPDPLASSSLGMRRILTDLPEGRAVDVATGRDVQVVETHLEHWIDGHPRLDERVDGAAPPVGVLPTEVKVSEIRHLAHLGEEWVIPVGTGATTLEPVAVRLGVGDHLLVVGDPRSGRSSLLSAIASAMSDVPPGLATSAIVPRTSPLRHRPDLIATVTDPDDIADHVAFVMADDRPHLVLIDDADDLDEVAALTRLVTTRDPRIRVVAAARRDLKTAYQHWAKNLTRSRVGVWLQPAPGVDGDLWSTPMPRRVPPGLPVGRGFLVAGGMVETIQSATDR